MKRNTVIFVLLAILTVVTAFAAGCTYSDIKWDYDDGELNISGKGNIVYTVDSWRQHGDDIKNVIIDKGITGIGAYCFENLGGIKKLTIPEGVKFIGEGAFSNCDGLTAVTIPESVEKIEAYAFEGCDSLNEVIFKGKSDRIKIGENAFPGHLGIGGDVTDSDDEGNPSPAQTTKPAAQTTTPDSNSGRPTASTETTGRPSVNSVPTDTGRPLEVDTAPVAPEDTTSSFYHEDTAPADTDVPGEIPVFQEIVGISLESYPDKMIYNVGDSFDAAGLGIRIIFADGSSINVTEGFTVTPESFTVSGSADVTVEYYGFTESFTVTVYAAETDVEITGITVAKNPNKTSYYVGDSIISEGLTLNVTYSDGSVEMVTRGYTFLPSTVLRSGYNTISVEYGGKQTSFSVYGTEVTLTKISVSQKPSKTSYTVGESLNTSGLRLTATYNNGTTETISYGYTCSPTYLSSTGTKTITVSYGGKTASFTVTVNEAVLTSISVSQKPSKTSYYVGETLNTSGLRLTATYSNGSTETISYGYTCSPTYLSSAGTKTITVSYGGKTTSFTVSVNEVTLTSISVSQKPTKTEYNSGESLNTSGLRLTAKYSDGSTETISYGYTCSPTTLTGSGTKTITVSYGGKTTSFTVTIKAVTVISITLTSYPRNMTYEVGSTLDTSGMILTLNYSNGTIQNVTSGFTCTPTRLSTVGSQTIKVNYNGYQTSFNVTVTERVPVGIRIESKPTKTNYIVGDKLNTSGFELVAVYRDGSTEKIYNGYTFAPSVLTRAGYQDVAVIYGNLIAKFEVYVAPQQEDNYSLSYDYSSSTADGVIKRGTPSIDGKLDSKYTRSLALKDLGTADNAYGTDWWYTCTADVYFLYDNTYLYICAVVDDDDVLTKGESFATGYHPYQNDNIEFRLSLNGDETETVKVSVDAYGYACYGLTAHYSMIDYSRIKYCTTYSDTQYIVEVAIPHTQGYYADLLTVGALGFTYQLNDINTNGKHVNHTTSFYGEAVKMPVFYTLSDEYA